MTDVDRKTKNIVVRCLRPYKGYGLLRERDVCILCGIMKSKRCFFLHVEHGTKDARCLTLILVTHLHETSRMSAEFVFRYGPKCMGGVILPILVLLHL